MRIHIRRVLGTLFAFALLSPAGFLFGKPIRRPVSLTAPTANWAASTHATALINRVEALSLKVRREAAPITVQGNQLAWEDQSSYLSRIRHQVNEMADNLGQLSRMKNKLEPWQQKLLQHITPNVHELVYQTEAAINTLKQHENRLALAITQYPGYVDQIYRNANQVAGSVGTFTNYVNAAQKLDALKHSANGARASS